MLRGLPKQEGRLYERYHVGRWEAGKGGCFCCEDGGPFGEPVSAAEAAKDYAEAKREAAR